MSQQTIKEINSSQTFRFDKESSRVVNLKSGEETDIEEFCIFSTYWIAIE